MNAILLAAAIWLGWDFEPGVLDTLEYCDNPGSDSPVWTTVPGPYQLNTARTTYRVQVDDTANLRVFRVARIWGTPWVYPD